MSPMLRAVPVDGLAAVLASALATALWRWTADLILDARAPCDGVARIRRRLVKFRVASIPPPPTLEAAARLAGVDPVDMLFTVRQELVRQLDLLLQDCQSDVQVASRVQWLVADKWPQIIRDTARHRTLHGGTR